MKLPADFEQMGYEAWLERWVYYGTRPTSRDAMHALPRECVEGSDERRAWLRGWQKARDES